MRCSGLYPTSRSNLTQSIMPASTSGKRHELACEIQKVAYITYDVGETNERKRLARILANCPGHILINSREDGMPIRLPPDEVNAALNRAAVGLCLSKMEGANYASMEYMLAGLPIVSTPSIGGREVYFDHEFCTICDPHPAAVRKAVKAMKERNIPRDYIRERTLAKIKSDRHRFLSLVDDISEVLGGKRNHRGGLWPSDAPSGLASWQCYEKCLCDFEMPASPRNRLSGFSRIAPRRNDSRSHYMR